MFLISPFVGRIYDWYVKSTGKTYAPKEDPGVLSVRAIYNYYKAHDIPTVVMGASFRSTGQLEALAGCDRLTIAPNLLEELAASDAPLERALSPDRFEPEDAIEMDENRFRWEMNEDPMATEMLAARSATITPLPWSTFAPPFPAGFCFRTSCACAANPVMPLRMSVTPQAR